MLSIKARRNGAHPQDHEHGHRQVALGDILDPFGDDLDQAGFFGPGNDHEQGNEEDQGGPFDFMFQHLDDIHLADHQQIMAPIMAAMEGSM